MGFAGFSLESFGRRFSVVGLTPTLAVLAVVGALVAAGAPAREPTWEAFNATVGGLSATDIGLLVAAAIMASALLEPFQFALVQMLEGYWPSLWGLRFVRARRLAFYRERFRRAHAYLDEEAIFEDEANDPERVARRVQWANAELDRLPLRSDRLLPTRLGNTLRRAEDAAGDRYGLDAIEVVPRIYPLASPTMTSAVDGARRELDLAVRFVLAWTATAGITSGLLLPYGAWLVVPLGAYLLAWASYRGAVLAARGYGESLTWLIDLHRFELVERLGFPRPEDAADERAQNRAIMSLISGYRLENGDDAGDEAFGALPRYRPA